MKFVKRPQEPERATMSVESAAKLLGIARGSMYQAVRRGEVPSVRIGRRIVIPRRALERLLSGESEENRSH